MFVTDKTIFLQLQKTGSMHISKLLALLFGGYEQDRHCRLPEDFDIGSRLIVSSIRDPWDWYLSLWRYGCRASMYGLRKKLTEAPNDCESTSNETGSEDYDYQARLRQVERWRSAYSDVGNAALFREWLKMILDPAMSNQMGESYADYPLHEFAGFLTHRYIMLHSRDLLPLRSVLTVEDLIEFDREQNIADVFIRNEHLEADFVAMLDRAGLSLNDHQLEFVEGAERTNASNESIDVAQYYDDFCVELVARKEAFIIEKHNYSVRQSPNLVYGRNFEQ